jgi:hypothetical protein
MLSVGAHPSGAALRPYLCTQKGHGGIWSRFGLPRILTRASAASFFCLSRSCARPSSFMTMASFPASLIRDSSLLGLEKKWFLFPQGDLVVEVGEGGCRAAPLRRRDSKPLVCFITRHLTPRFRISIPASSCAWHASSPCARRCWGLTPTGCCGSTSSVVG